KGASSPRGRSLMSRRRTQEGSGYHSRWHLSASRPVNLRSSSYPAPRSTTKRLRPLRTPSVTTSGVGRRDLPPLSRNHQQARVARVSNVIGADQDIMSHREVIYEG